MFLCQGCSSAVDLLYQPVSSLYHVKTLPYVFGIAQARQLLTTGGLSLNHHKVADAQKIMTLGDLIDGRYAVLRAGKANYRVIVLDETMH